MKISLIFLSVHGVCALALFWGARKFKISKRWAALCTALFSISAPAVFLVWGPYRYVWLYAAAWGFFLLLAKGLERFYFFLRSQESLVRYLFWAAVCVFCGADWLLSIGEINLRRDELTFWSYAVRIHPDAGRLVHLADAYDRAHQPDKAKDLYLKAVQANPRALAAYQGLGRLARAEGHWQEAVEDGRQLISLDPRARSAYLDLGEAYRALGETPKAVETYSRLLELFPDDEKIHVQVIEAYGRAIAESPRDDLYKEKREEALAEFEQLSKRKHYNAGDYYNLGFLYEQVGGKDEAMRFYAKALQMKPDYPSALYNLADLYRDTGNFKEALGLYARLVHVHPREVQAYLNMGEIFNAMGDPPRARQFYLKVVKLSPDNGDAYFHLGYLSESQGELREAENYYEKAVEVAPKNAEAYYNLGNVYASLGQNAEAIASYLKTVGINPSHQDAFVNLSILSFKSRDFQGAIHYLENARALGYNPPSEYLKTLEPYRK